MMLILIKIKGNIFVYIGLNILPPVTKIIIKITYYSSYNLLNVL